MQKISVIIPTFNKGGRLVLALTSFCYQDTSVPFEIILVDGGDEPNLNANHFLSLLPLKIVTVKNRGRSYNRNVGIKAAEGDLLIFSDDDCIVEPSFISSHWRAHQMEADLLVHGWKDEIPYTRFFIDPRFPQKGLLPPYQNRHLSDDLMSYAINAENLYINLDIIRQWGHTQDRLEKTVRQMFLNNITNYQIPWLAACTANMSLPRSLALKVGLFEEAFGLEWGPEDIEFGYRVYKFGGRLSDAPQAHNYHLSHARKDGKAIARRGFARFQSFHPEDLLISEVAEFLVDGTGSIDSFLKID
ncbi:glycosyltransferase family 2 protein [Lacrimispora brassicae]